jgi:hypothetical protein
MLPTLRLGGGDRFQQVSARHAGPMDITRELIDD